MNVHKNARLTPLGRERIVRQVASGQTPEAVGKAAGVCPRTVRKWVERYRREGLAGLQDRSSRPHRLHRPTPQAVVEKIERLRRQRWTGKQIAAETGVSPATVSRVLRRLGLEQAQCLGAGRTDSALRAGESRRAHPYRYQEARPHRLRRASHHRTTNLAWSIATSASVGSTSMSASTMPHASPSCRSWPISAKRALSPSSRPPLPITPNSAFASSA